VPWLLREGTVLAATEVTHGRRARRQGLLGRDGIDGALLVRPARSVHTWGMRFPIDVAYCAACSPEVAHERDDLGAIGASLVVLDTVTMPRWRLGRPRWRASCVIEAEAGAFERWRLAPGDRLEVR
jgi:hypothetical protein